MTVKNLIPNRAIAAYVERVLVIENYQMTAPFSLPLFANGSPTLLFISTKGTIGDRPAAHLTMFGQTILPQTLSCTEGFLLIAYFFKPYALHSLFGVASTELTDQPVGLDLLAPKQTAGLLQQLLNTASAGNKMALLDHYISGLIANAKSDCPVIQYAANKISQCPSPEILVSLQKELHLTERTFQRKFEKNIGIAPNLYRRVCQFHAAFQQLNNCNYKKLSDIAFQNGYADQSHYVRAFKEFTCLLPTGYLNFGA